MEVSIGTSDEQMSDEEWHPGQLARLSDYLPSSSSDNSSGAEDGRKRQRTMAPPTTTSSRHEVTAHILAGAQRRVRTHLSDTGRDREYLWRRERQDPVTDEGKEQVAK